MGKGLHGKMVRYINILGEVMKKKRIQIDGSHGFSSCLSRDCQFLCLRGDDQAQTLPDRPQNGYVFRNRFRWLQQIERRK